ncbi:MAG: MFS transporter [Tetrasphaera sp.]|nr:MFS transporter [Tetrasphaera sp.]
MRRFFSPYRVLTAMPATRHFLVSAYVTRLGMAMFGVAIVVMVATRRDSYAVAGAVSLVGLGSMAVGGPLLARMVDRYGQRRVAVPGALLSVVGLLVLALETYLGAPTWALLVTNTTSAFSPGVGALVRSRWSHVLDGDPAALHVANSFEQVSEESCFVLGPALGAGLATTLFPEAGLLIAGALFLGGFLALMAHRVSEPPIQPHQATHPLGAFTAPGLVQLAITLALTGAVFGGMDVVVLAYAGAEGVKAWGGALIGFFAAGSMIGGLVYGLVEVAGPVANRVSWWTLAMFAGLVPLLWVPGVAVLGVNGFLAGLFIAPTLITSMSLCQRLVPAAQLNEGMTIVVTGLLVGVGLGSAAAGQLIETRGAHASFMVPVAAAGIAFVLALLGRSRLQRAEARGLALAA